MSSTEPSEFDARIRVHDLYLIILWDTNFFKPDADKRRICGTRVCEGLFSVEAFASNGKPEYRLSRAIAEAIRPELETMIKDLERTLKEHATTLMNELDDPLVKAVDVSMPEQQEYIFTIDKGKGTPLVNSFIRLFVLTDNIQNSLKELHYRGAISKKEQKQREDIYTKPLRKLMNDLNVMIKKFHKRRKELVEQ
ncbi:hypothetical protein ACYHMX_30490 (plasmid) [Pseudomonas amygdali pv. morsprunorum]|uniref:DUF1845 domain-containing protein n=1 Tax=Pseudomonas amygdali pv. ulmi TaxID=251720 RepID=A0A0Q0IY97_PSEA0|nr:MULTISPECIES: hypothetical protein [Pseudomonas syringae group]KPW69580.1 hypothetical protein ALO78_200052 [Pseudomonas amygdali pv. ciccaronei]KPZ06407.1 hypothetical protein ALO41_200230 [Pseudomonas amygdali pv. ulmi]KWS13589.1 hypothetical protein AL065_29280 [Pseudomonas amygdali pv. ulmi]MBN3470686.1 hypothetical protein [Pseudomonas savastanoi pv. phaseolicola]MBN3477712.1 hypothetical protein [Pseudomonas savastanoi pv. phaseolicola]